MQLSVVILNYNVCCFLELCIKSVKRAIEEVEAEIIVVDNNSPDESCQMVKDLFPDVILLENKENVGFAKANNQAVEIAKGEYVCILNPDTVVSEDTFVKLLQFAKTKSKLGAIGCQLIDGKGAFLPESKRNVPTPLVSLKKALGLSNSYYFNNLTNDEVGEVSVLVGAFMFLKKSVYQEVGGFDERYFMYGEDIDLSYTLTKAGYKNYYFGETTVLHFKGESTLKDATYARRFYGAMELFYKKHFKKNVFIAFLVKFGVRLIPVLKTTKEEDLVKTSKDGILISKNQEVFNLLKKHYNSLEQIDDLSFLSDVNNEIEIIFDMNLLSYKSVISEMKKYTGHSISFKILPSLSQFVIGSDSSKSRGEVVFMN